MNKFFLVKEKILENKVLKAGIGFTVASLLLRAIGFLSTPVFSRIMDPSEYGLYNTYLAYEGIFYIIIGLALHSSIQNAKYEFEGQIDKYVSSILLIDLFSLFAWLIIVNIFIAPVSDILGFSNLIINILVIHSFCNSILQVLQSRLAVDYNYKKYLWVSLFNAIMDLGISVFLILTLCTQDKYTGRIIGNFLPVFLVALLTYIYFFKMNRPRINKKYWRFGLKFSLPIIPHGISQIVLNQFDRIMIRQRIGAAEAGLYSFGYSLSGICMAITAAMETAYTPWFYEMMNQRTRESRIIIKKRSSLYAILLFSLSSVVMLASPELLKIMGPESYGEVKYVCIPILLGSFFSTLYSIPIQVEYYFKKTKYIAVTTCFIAILNIVLNSIFIDSYGYIAAAYTTLFSYILYFIFHYFMAIHIQGMDLFDKKVIFGVSLLSFVIGGFTLKFIDMFFVRVIIGVAMFGAAIKAAVKIEKKN